MKKTPKGASKTLASSLVALALVLIMPWSFAGEPGEKPIGGIQEHRSGSPFKPLYASDIKKDITSFKEDVDKMATSVEAMKLDSSVPKDEIERQIDGALSLNRHRRDLVALRDKFSLCMAAMENQCADKMETGKATDAETKSMTACTDHCKKMLAHLDNLHHNTSVLITATRKTYLLNAWEQHQKMVAELKTMADQCPMMIDETIKTSGMPEMNPEKASTESMPDMASKNPMTESMTEHHSMSKSSTETK